MNIRFVSSLTPQDEERCAPVVLKAMASLLDTLPLAYTLRLETDSGMVFQHTHQPTLRDRIADTITAQT